MLLINYRPGTRKECLDLGKNFGPVLKFFRDTTLHKPRNVELKDSSDGKYRSRKSLYQIFNF